MATILFADDARVMHNIYTGLFGLMGHTLIPCWNGREAVDAFLRSGADLVLLDVEMPVMNGLAACREIRLAPGGAGVPIVIVSSCDTESDILAGLNAGANDYLVKPVREAHLIAKVKSFLGFASFHKNDLDLAKEKAMVADRYRISRLLGCGSHAVVFQAEDTGADSRTVAVKLLKETVQDPFIRSAFLETAARMRGVASDHVVKILDAGVFQGRAYTVMEHCGGGSLAGRLKSGPLTVRQAAAVGGELCSGLLAMANAGVLHLDVKPANILVERGQHKLSDFGVVRSRATETVPLGVEIWGTPAYTAPEFFTAADDLSVFFDVYSLGVCLYEAVTRDNPFVAGNTAATMYRQVNTPAPPLQSIFPRAPASFSGLLERMLSKKPGMRPYYDEAIAVFVDILTRPNSPELDQPLAAAR